MGADGAVDNDGAGDGAGDEAGRVARFLRDNPGWLAEQGELYGQLEPPRRVHGERLADHMAAMIEAARTRAETMEKRVDTVLRQRRTARTLAEGVREAVLALLRGAETGDWLREELPLALGIDGASLCAEGRGGGTAGWAGVPVRMLPPGMAAALLRRDGARLRGPGEAPPEEAALLHGEAAALARHAAVLAVPVEDGVGNGGAPVLLLALASRDDPGWGDEGGAVELRFLAAALGARIEAQDRADVR